MAREKWYTIREAAEFLGISTVTLRRYIKNHRISAYQIAGRYRFKKSALNEFLEACRLVPRKRGERAKAEKNNPNNPRANPQPAEQTEQLADEILRAAPRQARGLYIKAFAASRLGRYEEAESYYQRLLKSRPKDTAAYLFLGLLYLEMDKSDKALEMWRKVVNIDKESDLAKVASYHITRTLRAH